MKNLQNTINESLEKNQNKQLKEIGNKFGDIFLNNPDEPELVVKSFMDGVFETIDLDGIPYFYKELQKYIEQNKK